MHFLPVRPVSTNSMYESAGSRRWKSDIYMKLERDVRKALRSRSITLNLPEIGGLEFKAVFGVSFQFDLDNALKPFIDILEDFYKFNDNRISHIDVRKVSTKRGQEFIEFDLHAISESKVKQLADE